MGNLKISTESRCNEESKGPDFFSSSTKVSCNQRSYGLERKLTPAGKITFKEHDFWLGLICEKKMILIESLRARAYSRDIFKDHSFKGGGAAPCM